jgi:ribosomal protein S27AE
MSKVFDKIKVSALGVAKCINCGQVWGQHLSIRCANGGSEYQPLGFALSDRCLNCGDTLVNHQDRMICRPSPEDKKTCFELLVVAKDMFSEEDFLL